MDEKQKEVLSTVVEKRIDLPVMFCAIWYTLCRFYLKDSGYIGASQDLGKLFYLKKEGLESGLYYCTGRW